MTDHPPPEVPCRDATDEEVPRAAQQMRRSAMEAGWSVLATYARGTRMGRPPRVVDSLALRMRRNGHAAVAVWSDGKFALGLAGLVGRWPERMSANELKRWLRDG